MRILAALIGLTTLGACASADLTASDAFRDHPFDTGPVYVVTSGHGDLHTYALTPCRGGTHICGASGHVGQVTRTPDFYVVTGAYRNRTFHLSPGGDGFLNWRGVNRDLAWN